MRIWLSRAVLALLALALVILAALLGYGYLAGPRVSGTVKAPGLAAEAAIVRDADGMPHITAQSLPDAVFALGYAHAQDRLWQMEMNRRIAAGRLAEILGPGALPTDRFLRTVGVAATASQMLASLDPETRTLLQRYADGVNAYLDTRTGPLPPEFLLTGAPAPAHWTVADSLGWAIMMAWDLAGNWTNELLRLRLSQHLSKAEIDQLLPPYPGDDGHHPEAPLPVRDYTDLYRKLGTLPDKLALAARAAPESLIPGKGSNNWVVSGAHTKSGKPLLANDPHLGLSAPSLWYFAELNAPGMHVEGATLPGLPAVILGHNDRIAWGWTNTGPDTQDLYVEELDGDQVRTPSGWEPLTIRTEVIHVKGAADVTLKVRSSRHGPLLSDIAGPAEPTHTGLPARYGLAFSWTVLKPGDETVTAVLNLDRAHDWSSFIDAVRKFGSAEQNMVYADVDGNIGYVAPGRVPVRRADNDLMGQAPAPGWDERYDWTGYLPFEALPQRFNPPSGMVATANQKIVPDDYQPFLTAEWEPPFRARRIRELLEATPQHDRASFERIQADQRSLAAVDLLPILRTTVPATPLGRAALARLARWDGTMAAGRPEPLIYNLWVRHLTIALLENRLSPELAQAALRRRQVFLYNALADVNATGAWCSSATDPAVTADPARRAAACAALRARTLDETAAELESQFGRDLSEWRWERVHVAAAEHRPFSQVPVLSRLFTVTVPVGGDPYTVDAAGDDFASDLHPFQVGHGPSMRAIYDLSDLGASEYMYAPGPSGLRFSAFYDRFMLPWAEVQYRPLRSGVKPGDPSALGTLTLEP